MEAEVPSLISDAVVYFVIENSRTLKFTGQGVERERGKSAGLFFRDADTYR